MDPLPPLNFDPALREVLSQLATDVTQRVHCCNGCPPREKGGWRPPLLFEHILHVHERNVPKNWKCTYKTCDGDFFNTLNAISHKHNSVSYIQPYYTRETLLSDSNVTSQQSFKEMQTAWEKPWFIYNETMLINSIDKLIRDGYLVPGPRLLQQNRPADASARFNAGTENPSTPGVSYSQRRPPSRQQNPEPPRSVPAPAPVSSAAAGAAPPTAAVTNERSTNSTSLSLQSPPENVSKRSPIRRKERGESPPMTGSTTPRDRPHLSPRRGTSPRYQPNTPIFVSDDEEEPVFIPSWERNQNQNPSTNLSLQSPPENISKTSQQEQEQEPPPRPTNELERRACIKQFREAELARQSTRKSGGEPAQPSKPRQETGTIRRPPIRRKERGESPPMAGSTTPRDRPHLSPRGGTSPRYQPSTPIFNSDDEEEPVFIPSWESNQNQNQQATTPVNKEQLRAPAFVQEPRVNAPQQGYQQNVHNQHWEQWGNDSNRFDHGDERSRRESAPYSRQTQFHQSPFSYSHNRAPESISTQPRRPRTPSPPQQRADPPERGRNLYRGKIVPAKRKRSYSRSESDSD